MARGDLVVSLAQAAFQGDRERASQVVAALAAEARLKKQNTFADRLMRAAGVKPQAIATTTLPEKVRNLLLERPAERPLDTMVLAPAARRDITEFLEEQRRAETLMANGLEPRHRVMLVGPPGTGKTTLAEAMAAGLGVPFFVARYDSLVGSFLGETASRLGRIFEFARTMPCVLFLDEFDALGKERGDMHETGEIKRVVSSLLLMIDSLPAHTVVICATNHPELLDRAVWRRFQLRLELPMPERDVVAQTVSTLLTGVKGIGKPLMSEMVDILLGQSFAEVEQFCLDIRRKVALADGKTTIADIIGDVVSRWRERYVAHRPSTERCAGPVAA